MKLQYTPLITLECVHAYFAKGVCHNLHLQPTAQCRQLLERYDCLFRSTPSGGVIAFAKGEDMIPVSHFDEEIPFSFDLISPDPYFNNYTEVNPLSGSESVYYFSNLPAQGNAPQDNEQNPLLFPGKR